MEVGVAKVWYVLFKQTSVAQQTSLYLSDLRSAPPPALKQHQHRFASQIKNVRPCSIHVSLNKRCGGATFVKPQKISFLDALQNKSPDGLLEFIASHLSRQTLAQYKLTNI